MNGNRHSIAESNLPRGHVERVHAAPETVSSFCDMTVMFRGGLLRELEIAV